MTIYVQLSECGQHIRKWSREPFTEAQRFVSQPERRSGLNQLSGAEHQPRGSNNGNEGPA